MAEKNSGIKSLGMLTFLAAAFSAFRIPRIGGHRFNGGRQGTHFRGHMGRTKGTKGAFGTPGICKRYPFIASPPVRFRSSPELLK